MCFRSQYGDAVNAHALVEHASALAAQLRIWLLILLRLPSAVIPLGRLGTADEAAAAYEFLLHPSNSYITGLVLNVDGGLGSIRVATPGNPEAPKSHD